MKLIPYDLQTLGDETVYIKLLPIDDNEQLDVVVVDKTGRILKSGHLVRISKAGIYLNYNVNSEIGFTRDDNGRLKLLV